VISRHNEIRDELVDLAAKAFPPSSIRLANFLSLDRLVRGLAREGYIDPNCVEYTRRTTLTEYSSVQSL
jgi:hypothetical protein